MSHSNRAYEFNGDVVEKGSDGHANSYDVKYKTQTERKGTKLPWAVIILAVILFAAVVVIVVLGVLLAEEKDKVTDLEGREVCTSPSCVTTAARIQATMDETADPCQDFFQYACGGWLKKNVIPDDRSSFTVFTGVRSEVTLILKNLLETKKTNADPDYIVKVKDWYASCMNLDAIERKGDAPLKKVLTDKFGGWPSLLGSAWSEASFGVSDLAQKLRIAGFGTYLFNFYVNADDKNSSKYVIKIDQPGLGMPNRDYLLDTSNNSVRYAYHERLNATALAMGVNIDDVGPDVQAVLDFEIQLANISIPADERRESDATYHPTTLGDLQTKYGAAFNWKAFVRGVMGLVGTDVPDQETIINRAPKFFDGLFTLIKKTPKRTLANFMISRFIDGQIDSLSEKFRLIYQKFQKVVLGKKTSPSRYVSCSGEATSTLPLAVGKLFIRDNFKAEAKTEILKMIDRLQESFDEIVDQVDWMDEDTKLKAKEKNKAIKSNIGYPENIHDDTYLSTLYQNLTFKTDDYFDNAIANAKEFNKKGLRYLRQSVKSVWTDPPSTVNAYYSPSSNQMYFPAGILQPPLYSFSNPKSLNYGGIGVVIGHEITHGFDDEGRQYNKDGNLVQWWSNDAVKTFKKKAQCIINQYGNYTMEQIGMNLNGILTQGENIADNGGLKESFKAYRKWVSTNGKEEAPLPGIDLTHNQLFFLNFAQVFCSKFTDQGAKAYLLTNYHSPGQFRVTGTLQNSPEFHEAFKCKPGSFMNRNDKCSVW